MGAALAQLVPGRIVRARAPLRLGFGGGGTDVSPYCDEHAGVVLNATIDLFAHATVSASTDGRLSLTVADRDATWTGEPRIGGAVDPAVRLLKAVYDRFAPRFVGGPPALSITTYSDCPPGSGLGSSSALVVALVEAMQRLAGPPMSPNQVARLAFEIERVDLRLAGGRQDQYAAAWGGFNYMRFQQDGSVAVEPVRLPVETLKELEASLVLYFTGVSRESASVIDDQTENMRRKAPQALEALHALKAGAADMRQALLDGDLPRFGDLLDAGWRSKKALASRVSSPGIDEVYEAAKTFGVFGGKVSGAGGGGFMMFLVEPTRREALRRMLAGMGGVPATAKFHAAGVESWDAMPIRTSAAPAQLCAAALG